MTRRFIAPLLCSLFFLSCFISSTTNVAAQANQVLAQGEGFQLYQVAGGGFNFQHIDWKHQGYLNRTVTIEILTGVLNATNVRLGLTDRYGDLYFHSNFGCEIQLSADSNIDLKLSYDGMEFSELIENQFNGTIQNGADVLIHWSFIPLLPHEENWVLWLGILGIIILVAGILLLVYCFRNYPLFTFNQDKEMVWETDMLSYAAVAIIIGAGLTITWLLM